MATTTIGKCISPDDFVAAGLQRLWTVLQGIAEDGWDYSVMVVGRDVDIGLRRHKRGEPFREAVRILSAATDGGETMRYVILTVHDGGFAPFYRRYVFSAVDL